MSCGRIKTWKTKFDGAILVSLRDIGGELAVIEFRFNFMRLQVVVCEFASGLLPLSRAITELDIHALPR